MIGHRHAQLELIARRAEIGVPDPDLNLATRNGGEAGLARSIGTGGEAGIDDVDEGDHVVVDVAAERDDTGPIEMHAACLLAGIEPQLEPTDRREGINMMADII